MQPHRSNALDGAAAALSFDSGTHARVLWPVHHTPQTTVMVFVELVSSASRQGRA